ncbi:MAG: hypothetical protein AAFY76_18795, partial [Cyanobacteria bacterium J06649_11]
MASGSHQNGFECSICHKVYTSKGGRTRHQNKCTENIQNQTESIAAAEAVATSITENKIDVTEKDIPIHPIPPNLVEPDPPPYHHPTTVAPIPSISSKQYLPLQPQIQLLLLELF